MRIAYPTSTDWSFLGEEKVGHLDDDRKDLAESFAWSALAALCAYRIGIAPISVRPCAAAGAPTWGTAFFGFVPPRIGQWESLRSLTYAGCGCAVGATCACIVRAEVLLPGPVGRVESVTIDGNVVPRSAYRIDGGNRLVRTDGGVWPLTQDMNVDPPAAGTFVVTYYRGTPPNPMLDWAAGKLAWEFYRAMEGDDSCKLPGNLVSLARGGEAYQFGEKDRLVPAGLPDEVRTVVDLYNPYGLRSAPTVASPDSIAQAPRVQTWT